LRGCPPTRLEYRTLLASAFSDKGLRMSPYQVATIRDYGDGDVEASWATVVKGGRKSTARGRSNNREANIGRSKARAKAEVRRKCMALGADHLLTLTYRQNMTDKGQGQRDFEEFVRLVHGELPGWKYVQVLERQERGAIHPHIAVKGFQDVLLLRTLWRQVVGEGNIDVEYKREKKKEGKWSKGNSYRWKKADLANYIAKYITKEPGEESKRIEIGLNERRFRASLNIIVPKVRVIVPWVIHGARGTVFLKAKDYVLEKVGYVKGGRGFLWEPEDAKGFYGWACSWG
jgi:hypothetical protein